MTEEMLKKRPVDKKVSNMKEGCKTKIKKNINLKQNKTVSSSILKISNMMLLLLQ